LPQGFACIVSFRIFNPVTQSEKFDPDGKFIKRYLPALSVPVRQDDTSPVVGITLGKEYPPLPVQHDETWRRTLERHVMVKKARLEEPEED
jgi:deoxyribodipyrimidine photo-lyase